MRRWGVHDRWRVDDAERKRGARGFDAISSDRGDRGGDAYAGRPDHCVDGGAQFGVDH